MGDGGRCRRLKLKLAESNDVAFRRLSVLCEIVRGSFQETAPRKTAENTLKHRNGSVDPMVTKKSNGSESLVVVTTLYHSHILVHLFLSSIYQSIRSTVQLIIIIIRCKFIMRTKCSMLDMEVRAVTRWPDVND